MIMEKFLFPQHPVRCIITGPSCFRKSVFLTNSILKIINEFEKIYSYSPSLHQDLYQNLIKCVSNYIPIPNVLNNLNEEHIDIKIFEIVINNDCEESDTEIETCETREEKKSTRL